jgi:uncharacterized damage-inducible protein DinB
MQMYEHPRQRRNVEKTAQIIRACKADKYDQRKKDRGENVKTVFACAV